MKEFLKHLLKKNIEEYLRKELGEFSPEPYIKKALENSADESLREFLAKIMKKFQKRFLKIITARINEATLKRFPSAIHIRIFRKKISEESLDELLAVYL